jgi:hypothetical protein
MPSSGTSVATAAPERIRSNGSPSSAACEAELLNSMAALDDELSCDGYSFQTRGDPCWSPRGG